MKAPVTEEKKKKLMELEEVFQEVGLYMTSRVLQNCDKNLTHPQFFTLKRLDAGPATVSEVAEYLGVSLSAITSMADRMVKIGYVARRRSDNDRRLVWLELTSEGKKVLTEAGDKRREIMHGFLSHLPEEDLIALHKIYLSLLETIKKSKYEAQ